MTLPLCLLCLLLILLGAGAYPEFVIHADEFIPR